MVDFPGSHARFAGGMSGPQFLVDVFFITAPGNLFFEPRIFAKGGAVTDSANG